MFHDITITQHNVLSLTVSYKVSDLISPKDKVNLTFENNFNKTTEKDELKLLTPNEWTDVTLIVERKKIYSSRAILASASRVWNSVLLKEFQDNDTEKNKESEINLPHKVYRDVIELLLCITPSINKLITSRCINV